MRSFLALAFLVPFLALAAPSGATKERPNVLVIVIDDIRWDALRAAGNNVVHTPRLDRLAREGVRFEQARVTSAICMVSRASLLTGQYMSRHGINEFGRALPPDAFAFTYPALLRGAGYWVGHVGKYDVGAARTSDFDFLRAYHGQHWITTPNGKAMHVTERNAADALDFLRERPKKKPFLLTIGFFAPHAHDEHPEQYLPQDWSAALYRSAKVPPPLRGDPRYLAALPPFLAADQNEGRRRYRLRFDTPEKYQRSMVRYYRLVTEVDRAVGRVLDELREQGVYDRTLVIVVGDNGYFQADRGLADKWYPYEEAIRVPLVIRDPRGARPGGEVRREMALNIDIAPTVVRAAGLNPPPRMQGRDLAQLYLAAKPLGWRDEFLYEHPTVGNRDYIPASFAVVRSDWKYVEFPEHEFSLLFDLKADAGEAHNLSDSAQHAARRSSMRQKLQEWRQLAR